VTKGLLLTYKGTFELFYSKSIPFRNINVKNYVWWSFNDPNLLPQPNDLYKYIFG